MSASITTGKKLTPLALALLLLYGCAVGPDFKEPVVDSPEAYRTAIMPTEAITDIKWWTLFDAAVKAANLRFRPILMTAFSFILGVLPLVVASGAGAEARVVMGVALLGGMALATMLGVFFYPMLFVFIGKIAGYEKKRELQKEQV